MQCANIISMEVSSKLDVKEKLLQLLIVGYGIEQFVLLVSGYGTSLSPCIEVCVFELPLHALSQYYCAFSLCEQSEFVASECVFFSFTTYSASKSRKACDWVGITFACVFTYDCEFF
jgi:hypothetical protein